jgi:cysteine synthase
LPMDILKNVTTPDCLMAEIPRDWLSWAIKRIESDFCRSADTHLLHVPIPRMKNIALYLKDESIHLTGSLKHRLARSLFLYALCNGWVGPNTTIIESSSGSTAVSEAYFARMLGLKFVAVVPRTTAQAKIDAIGFYEGVCHFVDRAMDASSTAAQLAADCGGHFMDQFTYAERATDWRGNNNIAESLFAQMANEPYLIPTWIVCGAGTGGTSATFGRYVRYNRYATRICVADPEASVFHAHWRDRTVLEVAGPQSLIEGIGRARLEPSFMPDTIDQAIAVSDTQSIAAARVVSRLIGKPCGGSTGTNIWAAMLLAERMAHAGENGSIATILCDSGERYRETYFNDAWIAKKGIDLEPATARLTEFFSA